MTVNQHNDDNIIDGMSLADRAEHLARMNQHPLMKNSAVLNGVELDDWLNGAKITHHPDHFGGGFEILYGFDQHGQDFIVVRNQNIDGPHFAIIAD